MIPVTKHKLYIYHGNHPLYITSKLYDKEFKIEPHPVPRELFRVLLNIGESFVFYTWNIVRAYGQKIHMKYTGFQLLWTDWVGLPLVRCCYVRFFFKENLECFKLERSCKKLQCDIYLSQYQETKSPYNFLTPHQNLILVRIIVSLKSAVPISKSLLKSVERLCCLRAAFVF